MYNLLIGGAAGQGIETATAILEKILKRAGYSVFTARDFMSRVRGGHNFSLIRFGTEPVLSHSYTLTGIVALNEETIRLHKDQLDENGFILCDSRFSTDDPRAVKIKISEMADALGNARVAGSIAIGAVLKLFNESLDDTDDVFEASTKKSFLDINLMAAADGYKSVDARYPHLDGNFSDDLMISGSQAIALGAMAAGMNFYCAYPMSPATPIMVYIASNSDETEIVVEQAEDEIAAINMAIGASYAGARAMTATSGGGFSLMTEAFGLAGMAEIPLVVVDMQRPGPATGLPTRTEQGDLKFVVSAAQGEFPRMVIAPRSQEDAFYQTARAFSLAEKYQIPVVILCDQYLGDASAAVKPFDLDRIETKQKDATHDGPGEYMRYRYTQSGVSPRLIPGKTKNFVMIDSDEHDERGWITESASVRTRMMDKRMRKLEALENELEEPALFGHESFDTLLIGWGSMQGPIAEAVQILNRNQKYAALVFGDVFPLPQRRLKEKAARAKRIVCVEQNATGQLQGLIREQTGIVCTGSVRQYDGRQMTGEDIAARLMKEDR